MPEDVVEISDARHEELQELRASGKEIIADADGNPVAIDQVAVPVETSIPISVTMYQARSVLIDDGLDEAVEAAIEQIADPIRRKKARAAWLTASTVDRNSDITQLLAEALQLSDAQLDDLFLRASSVI